MHSETTVIQSDTTVIEAGVLTKQDVANAFVDTDAYTAMLTPDPGSLYRRFFGDRKTPTGASFEERTSVDGANIKLSGHPDMGFVPTTMSKAFADGTEFYGQDLIGALIVLLFILTYTLVGFAYIPYDPSLWIPMLYWSDGYST